MDFAEALTQTIALLERQGWVSYQTLRRRFRLDPVTLQALKEELLRTQKLVQDEGNRLQWRGALRPRTNLWQADPSMMSARSDAAVLAPAESAVTERRTGQDAGGAVQMASPAGGIVGREQEQQRLQAMWTQVQAGQGHVVVLRGEAGIGKSRLAQFVKTLVANAAHLLWDGRGTFATQHTAFYTITELLQRIFRLQQEDTPANKLQKIEAMLVAWGMVAEAGVPLLAALLSIPWSKGDVVPGMTPARQRQRTMEILLHCLQAATAQQPVVLIMEDLHWMDASTREWLELVVKQVASWRLFVVLTCRPEFHLPWTRSLYLTPLTLGRFLPSQTEALVRQVAGPVGLPAEVIQQLVSRTEGVPLVIEELTKTVLEFQRWHRELGNGSAPNRFEFEIPTTLYDSLMTRLKRLGSALEVAQMMSVWGRGATEAQLLMATQLDHRHLDDALERLVTADILQVVHLFPRVTYVFKHVLLQEAVYTSMPPEMRYRHHQQVAALLKKHGQAMGDTPPELLAHHYMQGGMPETAVSYWLQAGQRAMERSAHHEAVTHLRQGLAVLETLPRTPERLQEALSLQTIFCLALRAIKGYAAAEVEEAYAAARQLCQQVGDTPQLAQILWGLAAFYLVRAELSTACELGAQLLSLGQRQHSPALLMEAYLALAMPLFQNGDVSTARAYFAQAAGLYREQEYQSHAMLYGQDPGVVGLSYGAWASWLLGYPQQALEQCQQAMALAERLAHPYSKIFALAFAARVYQCCCQWQQAQQLLDTMMLLAREHGVTYYQAQGAVMRGGALVMQGQVEEGMAQMQAGMRHLRETGTTIGLPSFLLQLAQGYHQHGQTEMALVILEESLMLAAAHEIRYQEAEQYRLKAEWIFALSQTWSDEIESYMRHALEVSRRQKAKSLELRTAISWGRLSQQHGKKEAAYRLLSEVYSWFSEGRETADLQEAALLLTELA